MKPVYKTLRKAQKRGELSSNLNGQELADAALQKGLVDKETADKLAETEELRLTAIGVDSFAPGIIENNQFYTAKGDIRKAAVKD
jgi:acyl-CoA dehydrogenase